MKRIELIVIPLLVVLMLLAACGGPQPVKTAPEPAAVPPAPPPPTAPPDPQIQRAYAVLRHFGTLTRRYMSYREYARRRGGADGVASVSPDWFYDTYSLDLNEKDYWVKVNFQTARRAIERDPRIETLLGNAPRNAIDMTVKTPAGRKYVLSDSEADGVLDYAAPARAGAAGGAPVFNTELRDRLQKTYTWILGIIKGYFPKIPRLRK